MYCKTRAEGKIKKKKPTKKQNLFKDTAHRLATVAGEKLSEYDI